MRSPLTDEVTEPCSQLNLGLDKRVAIVFEGNEEDLFHLVGQLPNSSQGRCGDRRQHLRSQNLENFLLMGKHEGDRPSVCGFPTHIVEDGISLCHQPSNCGGMDDFPMVPVQRAPKLPEVHLELIASPRPD